MGRLSGVLDRVETETEWSDVGCGWVEKLTETKETGNDHHLGKCKMVGCLELWCGKGTYFFVKDNMMRYDDFSR